MEYDDVVFPLSSLGECPGGAFLKEAGEFYGKSTGAVKK